jgi:fructose-1,6-bisphosphatase-3
MPAMTQPDREDAQALAYLGALARLHPTIDAALGRIAHLNAVLTLPKGTVHVLSDVHGDFKKLKHVVNNGSGSLRPFVDQVFGERLDAAEKVELLNLIYYPSETFAYLAPRLSDMAARRAFLQRTLRRAFELVFALSRRYAISHVEHAFPAPFRLLCRELLLERALGRDPAFVDTMLEPFLALQRELDLLRAAAHVVRDLQIAELLVAGDMGDRGPRVDRVVDFLMRQPRVAITWGNHDVTWLGACLGHLACIATVLRISLRYRRLSQLEEGYGIPVAPLEKLARTVYGDDPTARFVPKGEGLRDTLLMARMQKAMAIIQFKLEGQIIRRHPEWEMEHRNLLHRIDRRAGTVTVDGETHPLLDTFFPTIDEADPYALTPEEEACMARLRQSFLQSQVLWQHEQFVVAHGSMYLRRDHNLIFHGCVPVDAEGKFLDLVVDGRPASGKALFDALHIVVQRAVRERAPADLDMLWYLWTGPRSPLFGKDRMATFEGYFIADEATHVETKNPYFKLIHEPAFCEAIFRDFGVDPDSGLIVNGHVPVKVEAGEDPVKRSRKAVTIDGAFSEAYGDRGYTLVLGDAGTYLARHHHFESVEDALTQGADIIPEVSDVRVFPRPRTVGDTEKGETIRGEIAALERLIRAYRDNVLREGN